MLTYDSWQFVQTKILITPSIPKKARRCKIPFPGRFKCKFLIALQDIGEIDIDCISILSYQRVNLSIWLLVITFYWNQVKSTVTFFLGWIIYNSETLISIRAQYTIHSNGWNSYRKFNFKEKIHCIVTIFHLILNRFKHKTWCGQQWKQSKLENSFVKQFRMWVKGGGW